MTQAFNHQTSDPANEYTYDTLDRLTQADYLVGIQTANEEFVYDDLGNRLTLKVDGSVDTTYSHNSANEYTHINSGTPNVAHDAAGNLSADQDGYEYEYDHDNRLTKITKDSGSTNVATYIYDALGRRIEFIDEVAAVTTRYYYDGWRVLTETDGSDTVQRDFIYGNYIDEALIMDDGDDHYYAHDHLFSVVALMDDTGAVAEYYEYDAYGKVDVITDDGGDSDWWDGDETHAEKSAQGNPYTFTGRRLDSLDNDDKPLMYYRSRCYDIETGRFIQRDKFESRLIVGGMIEYYDDKGFVDGLNIYTYVGNRPIVGADPFAYCIALMLEFEAAPYVRPAVEPIVRPGIDTVARPITTTRPIPVATDVGSGSRTVPRTDKCNRPGKNGSRCKRPERKRLQRRVDEACKSKKFKCNPSLSIEELASRKKLANECARARFTINQRCFKGGDDGHNEAFSAVIRSRRNCAELLNKAKARECVTPK